jgi:DNA-binding SARP family transcriptional activator
LEFGILGPIQIRDGNRVFAVSGAKQLALLAILLLHANEVVSSDRLIDELWAKEPPGSGATALQVLVSRLRNSLGPGGPLLVTQSRGYVMRLEHEQLDEHRFERLVADAEGAEPAVAAAKLREALALWRGPALAELAYESFAQAAIGRLEELRLAVLEKRIEADLALGRHADLVGELDSLVAEHPLRERFRGQLMVALYRAGRQAEALETYKASRRVLVEELGIEPSPGLQELEKEILRQDPSLDLSQLTAPARSILVASLEERGDALVELAELLARRPSRELIIARIVAADDLGPATARLRELRETLLAKGHAARTAAFATGREAHDLIRLASEQDVDLLLIDAGPALLDDEMVRAILEGAPCDVALLVGREARAAPGPVLVPFAGAEHDWSAIELGAWIAGNQEVPLRLAGPQEAERDASRLLASASLAVQRALGVAAEPLLVEPGPDALVRAAEEAGLVISGLSDRWPKEGLGPVRRALAAKARPPVILVRRGLRPGGLAPRATLTRFTWTLRPTGSISSS